MFLRIRFSDPMHYFIIFFLLTFLFQQSTSFSCLWCDRTNTTRCNNDPKPEDCKSGELAWDICSCCKQCARAEGEKCGGGFSGHCASNFYCHFNKDEDGEYQYHEIFGPKPGVCKQRPKNACSTTDDCEKYPLAELLDCNIEDSGCVCRNGKCKKSCK